jgi:hypothetical protein
VADREAVEELRAAPVDLVAADLRDEDEVARRVDDADVAVVAAIVAAEDAFASVAYFVAVVVESAYRAAFDPSVAAASFAVAAESDLCIGDAF